MKRAGMIAILLVGGTLAARAGLSGWWPAWRVQTSGLTTCEVSWTTDGLPVHRDVVLDIDPEFAVTRAYRRLDRADALRLTRRLCKRVPDLRLSLRCPGPEGWRTVVSPDQPPCSVAP